MSPIRLLMLISGLTVEGPMGGVARHAIELCKVFDRSIVEPILGALWHYQTPFDDAWLQRANDMGIETFIAADWDENAQYRSCVHAWRATPSHVTKPVDIIHSHGEFSDLAALLLRRQLRAKALVRTVHNEYEWSKRPLYGKVFPRFLYPLTFRCEMGVSEKVVVNLDNRSIARVQNRRSAVLRNAINMERFTGQQIDTSTLREELGIPNNAPVVGSVGRLVPQKGYSVLIDSAQQVLKHFPNVYFVLVGEGRAEQSLRAQVNETGLSSRVIFTGPRSDVEAMLALMDVFVSSSLWEGLPTVVLESMASGTPVVATNVSGNAQLIHNCETGLIVPPDDPESLANAIIRMLEEPALAQLVAKNAQALVEAEYSINSVARQLEQIYVELMSR